MSRALRPSNAGSVKSERMMCGRKRSRAARKLPSVSTLRCAQGMPPSASCRSTSSASTGTSSTISTRRPCGTESPSCIGQPTGSLRSAGKRRDSLCIELASPRAAEPYSTHPAVRPRVTAREKHCQLRRPALVHRARAEDRSAERCTGSPLVKREPRDSDQLHSRLYRNARGRPEVPESSGGYSPILYGQAEISHPSQGDVVLVSRNGFDPRLTGSILWQCSQSSLMLRKSTPRERSLRYKCVRSIPTRLASWPTLPLHNRSCCCR